MSDARRLLIEELDALSTAANAAITDEARDEVSKRVREVVKRLGDPTPVGSLCAPTADEPESVSEALIANDFEPKACDVELVAKAMGDGWHPSAEFLRAIVGSNGRLYRPWQSALDARFVLRSTGHLFNVYEGDRRVMVNITRSRVGTGTGLVLCRGDGVEGYGRTFPSAAWEALVLWARKKLEAKS